MSMTAEKKNGGDAPVPANGKEGGDEKKYDLVLEVIGGAYVLKPAEWVTHRRSKNYIAEILGTDKKWGFKRRFLERTTFSGESYFLLDDFKEGHIYEIRCVYYTGGGYPDPRIDDIFVVEKIMNDAVCFRRLPKGEAIKRATQMDAMKFPAPLIHEYMSP
jgi:hypothetical protein